MEQNNNQCKKSLTSFLFLKERIKNYRHTLSITFQAFSILSAGVILCILGGCRSKPPMLTKPVQNTWTVDAPFEVLWKFSIQALVEKGVQVDILDKEAGLIVVGDNFDQGSFSQYIAEPYHFYGGQARVNILFTKEKENKTRVTIKPILFGLGRSYYPIKVSSNGKLERDYYLIISGSIPKEKTYKWLKDVEPLKEDK